MAAKTLHVSFAHGEPAGQLRLQARSVLAPFFPADQVEDVLVVISELVQNVTQHTTGGGTLLLAWDDDGITVEVRDQDRSMPRQESPDGHRIGGRGLLLVAGICSSWGTTIHDQGKSVWARVTIASDDTSSRRREDDDRAGRAGEQRRDGRAGHEETRGVTTGRVLLQVLIVEDDLGDLALMENAFADHSIPSVLHHTADGADALAFLRRQGRYRDAPRPDLILLDLNMPRVDGRQVLAVLKADEDLASIPAVVFTTSAAAGDIVFSYGAHANAYVTKPADLQDYERVVIGIRNFFGHTAVLPRRVSDERAT
ncbi:hypothetical protein Acy02nite_81550 [Actinoplanes cyaneus]|uniref:Response regulatory domain-containing protein n=1 Tax=Actinoplanes cyaneus TaxID=52696 RepID=A0A919IQD4_9ACTN|nr:response regulator [Actinoplanes cyaneus]MCW2143424.1 CheY chemotaxis protein or a CheY-like REC (receiver) domain [Actinoplanes cyaneus]GID70274.1 hypothetical protein Acy02nite_81550 [Actinoplanes cyaneus]